MFLEGEKSDFLAPKKA